MNGFRDIAAARDEVIAAQQPEEPEEIEAETTETLVEEAPAEGAE